MDFMQMGTVLAIVVISYIIGVIASNIVNLSNQLISYDGIVDVSAVLQ